MSAATVVLGGTPALIAYIVGFVCGLLAALIVWAIWR